MPLSRRSKANLAVIAVLLLFWIGWFLCAKINSKLFFNNPINAKVVKSNDWWKRSIKYIFSDGKFSYFLVPVNDRIRIGDSISKPANSSVFAVYRKNDSGAYYFFRSYDNNKTN